MATGETLALVAASGVGTHRSRPLAAPRDAVVSLKRLRATFKQLGAYMRDPSDLRAHIFFL